MCGKSRDTRVRKQRALEELALARVQVGWQPGAAAGIDGRMLKVRNERLPSGGATTLLLFPLKWKWDEANVGAKKS